jgi:protein kinase-like protein
MDPSLWRRLAPILDRALDLTGPARAAFMQSACAGDRALLETLEAVLAADAREGGVLDAPTGAFLDEFVHAAEAERTRTRTIALAEDEVDGLLRRLLRERSRGRGAGRATTPAVSLSEAHGRFLPGTIVAGRYRIVARVGRGGMGDVYRADDIRIGQAVALKFLPESLEADAKYRDRMLGEVRHARQIAHPNVCRVYDVGEADGRLFLSMEFIDGEDLAGLLRRIGRLPREKAIDIAQQVCSGLRAAHDLGLVHRDLKPANVMLDGRGRARITDFGLAIAAEAAAGRAGEGTPAYMAPEQLEGHQATARSDVYALGLVLYELFTGRRAFQADSIADLRRQQLTSQPASPSSHVDGIDQGVDRAILCCLEKDPARRPASAAQVLAMLPGGDPLAAAVAAGETPSPEMLVAAGEEGALAPRTVWTLFAAVVLGLAGAVALGARGLDRDRLPAMRSPDSLRDRARDIVASLGRRAPPGADAWWFDLDEEYVRQAQVQGNLPSPAQARPPVLRFHYRESPRRLEGFGMISRTEPPLFWSGDAYVALDPGGALLALALMPPQVESGDAVPAVDPDWSGLLALTAVPTETLREVAPRWTPDVPSDSRRAWEGEEVGAPIRIEAAMWRGRPVWMRTVAPWNRPERDPTAPSSIGPGPLFASICLVTVGIFALLARHNLRLGRENRRGAFRFGVATYFCFAVGIVLRHFPATFAPTEIWSFFLYWATIPCFPAVSAWLYYLGVEPFLRRRWPHRLIALTRLLGGRLNDPLVGKEVLIGLLSGVGVSWINVLEPILGSLRGFDAPPSSIRIGPAYEFWGVLFVILGSCILNALGGYAIVLLLRTALRRETPAWIGLGLLVVVLFVSPAPPVLRWVTIALSACILVVAVRAGLISAALSWFVPSLLTGPLTLDPGRWYAWQAMILVASVAILALWGLRAAMGQRRILPALAMET